MKTTKAQGIQDSNGSYESTAEENIKSDDDAIEPVVKSGPQYSSVSSYDSEVEHIKTTPVKGRNDLRVSQSLIMDKSQIQRALDTLTTSTSLMKLNNWEQSSLRMSQASRITDAANFTNTQVLNTKKNQPKKCANDANKPLTRSRAKILASQNSQSNENNPPTTSSDCIIRTQAPSGSRLTIKLLKD